MTRLDDLYALRQRLDTQIAAEVERLEEQAQIAREKLNGIERRGWAACGTDGGYYRHRRTLKEPACTDCKAAHRVAEAARQARRTNPPAIQQPTLRLVPGEGA